MSQELTFTRGPNHGVLGNGAEQCTAHSEYVTVVNSVLQATELSGMLVRVPPMSADGLCTSCPLGQSTLTSRG